MIDSDATIPSNGLVEAMQIQIAKMHMRVAEIDTLISQEQLEVTRLRMKATEVTERVSRMANMLRLGIAPTSDFTSAYDDQLDIQTRLVKLQSHLERIHGEREQYAWFGKTLEGFIAILQPPPDEEA